MSEKIGENSYNLQTKTRWIFDLPISEILGERESLKDFRLNCINVSTPELTVGTQEESIQGYSIPIPNGNRGEDKQLVVTFAVSENLIQYAALLAWVNKLTGVFNDLEKAPDTQSITGRVWFLDSYLKQTGSPFIYEGLFITKLGTMTLDQSSQEGSVLTCTASFSYFRSSFDVNKILF